MSNLVPPHGADSLQPLLLPATERAEEARRAEHLKKVPLSSREVSDLFMLGMGAYTPLDGFMGETDWRGCCEHMRLENGVFWPIPITAKTWRWSVARPPNCLAFSPSSTNMRSTVNSSARRYSVRRIRRILAWKR